ncbi:unnamed protein product, partial [Iphiclides podalirius]
MIALSVCERIVIGSKVFIMANDYTYNRQRKSGHGWSWYCSMYHRGCKATITTTHDLILTEQKGTHCHEPPMLYRVTFAYNKNGKLIALCGGYTFYSCNNHCNDIRGCMWRCTKGYPCKARFKASPSGQVVRVTTLVHSHDPPLVEIHDGVLVKLRSFYCGVRGHKTNIWRCTRWGQCKARFIITMGGVFVSAQLNHTHDPPTFVIHEGIYYKI